MSYVDPDALHGAFNDFIGFVKDSDNAALLTAKGLNPATVQANLEGMEGDLDANKIARDKKKTELATAQQAFVDSGAANYSGFSSTIDSVAGTLGKSTPAGQQVLAIRSHLNAAPQTRSAPAPAQARPTA